MGQRTLSAPDAVEIEDEVRDLMIMTVPDLEDEELEGSVEPEHMMSDDGMDGMFIEAFIRDEDARRKLASEDTVRKEQDVPDGSVMMELPEAPVVEPESTSAETVSAIGKVSGVGWRVCFSF